MLANKRSVIGSENDINMEHPTSSLIAVEGKFVFQKGETFRSYDELQDRLEKHQKESFVYYWRRDTRTVERAFTKTSRSLASCLKYYTVHFACIFGGQKFQARGSGIRLRQRLTNRVSCPANIFFRASKCGKLLEVVSVCNLHNHQISEELNALLPQDRKISAILKEEVAELLNLKTDRQKIIEYVKANENKNITPKDLFNLAARLKASKNKTKNFNDRIKILNRIYTNITDEKIKEICNIEISNLEKKYCSVVETEQLVELEYIVPINYVSDNDTKIKSMLGRRSEGIDHICKKNSDGTITVKPENYRHIYTENVATDYNNIDKFNNCIDMESDISSISKNEMIEDYIVEEDETNNPIIPNQNTSPIIVYENFLDKDYNGLIAESIETNNTINLIEYEKTDEFNETGKQHIIENNSNEINEEDLQRNCTIILYETTTNNIDDSKNNHNVNNENNKNNSYQQKNLDMKKSVKQSFKKINTCYKCGSKTKLLNMQIKYLRSQRNKLIEETKLLKMKRKLLTDKLFI